MHNSPERSYLNLLIVSNGTCKKTNCPHALKMKTKVAGLPHSIPHAQSNSLTYNYSISYIKQFLYRKTLFIYN